MELKPYQQQVIGDLTLFLQHVQKAKDLRSGFHDYWTNHPRTPLQPFSGTAIEHYKNNIPKVPHVCIKVPTAGGKTFIACNALKPIFDAFSEKHTKAVIWLVPSITILDQTIKNLKNPSHPYRQKINAHFRNKVEVLDKQALLQGSGFNPTSVREQLNILVLSFDSLRAKNKEERKVFQENGNLQSFGSVLGTDEDISLMRVIQSLNPVLVVDESHNAETELSVEMLKNLNPSFILDLTATPRNNSNIISFVDALELKRENMVKLPVVVYNHTDKTEVINSALQLQRRLEKQAEEERKKGGKYIRPIVLFQAQPRSVEDNTTFEKLKEKLIELKIPAEHIKIKTATINELKNVNLMAEDCQVRYIITINALKEGWDCPFAYILASLADKSSAVDVEQILGRVLRQPYVKRHEFPLLNISYVLTASSKFLTTLDNIVKGLNKAGFSSKDYRLADPIQLEEGKKQEEAIQLSILTGEKDKEPIDDLISDIDTSRIKITDTPNEEISSLESVALKESKEFENRVANSGDLFLVPNELQPLVKTYTIKEIFRENAGKIVLPQFFLKIPANDIFGTREEEVLLDKENLLEGFPLSKGDTNVDFKSASADLYKVDLDENKKDHTPTFLKIDGDVKDQILAYLLDPVRKDSRVKNFTKRIQELIGNMYPIPDKEIEKYLNRLLEDFTDEQFNDFANNEYTYKDKIKNKIKTLSENFAEQKFKDYLDTDKVYIKPSYALPASITPGDVSKDITKALYEKEGKMNGFEEKMINEVANMQNIAFWTRNVERRGFCLNGFINHYPDFIISTKGGKTILVETKGDHLDAEPKIRLGKLWENKAGNNYRYFMAYEKREVDGAYRMEDFLRLIRDIQ
jgi:type III restriction enzyme